MPQQLASSFAKEGNLVLYINNTGVRSPRILKDFRRLIRKAYESVTSTRGFQVSKNQVTILQRLLIPLPYNKWAIHVNSWLLIQSIRKWYSLEPSRRPVVLITFLPTPLAYRLSAILNPAVLIYYCANNMHAGQAEKLPLIPWEQRFFRDSDLIFTISDALFAKASAYSRCVYSFPPGLDNSFIDACINSADYDEPRDLVNINRPRVGYVGSLAPHSNALDLDLILFTALANPELNIVLIGPAIGDVSMLANCRNIFMLGSKPHSEIPSYLAYIDVAIIPYKLNEFTLSVSSCKVNEYLAAGLPVVGTPLPELIKLQNYAENLIHIEETRLGFSDAVRTLTSQMSSDEATALKRVRTDYALSNSWKSRYAMISQLVTDRLHYRLASGEQDLQSRHSSLARFKASILKENRRFLIGLTGSVGVYFMVFISPFFSIIGYNLAPRDPLGDTDTIVVLTGDGVGAYHNDSFLLRSADILDIHSKNNDIDIIVSTARERLVSEVGVMKAYLVSKGIESDRIKVLQPSASSTWEHVKYISKYIGRDKRSIALLSSPFHARRAASMMRKQSSLNAYVVSPSVRDTPNSWNEWMPSLRRINIILYEVASLAYAYISGRA